MEFATEEKLTDRAPPNLNRRRIFVQPVVCQPSAQLVGDVAVE